MTGPIIPDDQWPDTVVAKLWTSAGACGDLAPFAGGWVLGVSSTPMPAGHDWRVPVMRRPTPAIDLEQFRAALDHALLSIQSEEKREEIERLLALIDGQANVRSSSELCSKVASKGEGVANVP